MAMSAIQFLEKIVVEEWVAVFAEFENLQFPSFEPFQTPGGVSHGLDEEAFVAIARAELRAEFLDVERVFGEILSFDEGPFGSGSVGGCVR